MADVPEGADVHALHPDPQHKRDTPMMACGHAANAKHMNKSTGEWEPSCVICFGDPRALQVIEKPDLTGRTARCAHYGRPRRHGRGVCDGERPSDFNLAFFVYRGPGSNYWQGESDHDEYYCGCWGWD